MGSYKQHQALVRKALIELSKLGCRAWQNQTGMGRSMDNTRVIRFGLPGSSDILGIIPPAGRLLAVEVKTGQGQQTKEQRQFQEMVQSLGGIYIVVREEHEVNLSQYLQAELGIRSLKAPAALRGKTAF